jgi:fumarate reductase flavoprotein subunit
MKQYETDIAIVGGGTSGLAAAVAAAERGSRVTIIEKAAVTGGTGNMAMGPFAVESRLQDERKLSLTRDEAFNIFMNYTHWRVDARLVREYINKTASTIDWLEKMGVEFYGAEAQFPGSHFTHHCVKLPGGGTGGGVGAIMMKVMTDRGRELGVQYLLQTTAKKILKEGGKIAGVSAESATGEEIKINAKAIIIGTGGFGDNPDMIKKYTGHEYNKDMFSMRIPGMNGEGIRMAWEAGAAPNQMSMEVIFSLPPPFHGRQGTRIELAAFRQPNLMVNLLGERFMNEEVIANTTYTGNAILRQKNYCSFVIFDSATRKYYEQNGMRYCDLAEAKDIDANIRQVWKEGADCIYVADTLEELASKTGIDLNGLKQTIEEYNKACDIGRDSLFMKHYKYLRPIREPKFYAGKMVPSAYGSLGGIKINYKLEVQDKNFEVIPGLYGVGVDVNNIYGDSYIFILPGNTMGFAINSGRMAGENATDYIKAK